MITSAQKPLKGSLLLVVMCFVAVLGIGLVSYVALASRAMTLSNRAAQSGLSKQLAETALEEALRAFNRNDWSSWTSGGVTVTWSDNGTSGKKAAISFPSAKFGQGVTASAKIRVDNANASLLAATWSSSASYRVNDVVGFSGAWYRCVTPNSNQTPTSTGNLAYWVPAPIPWKWSGDIAYSRHDVVNHNGVWYRCVPSSLTSSTAPSESNTDWVTIPTNVRAWSAATSYNQYDIVNYNGVNYRATTSSLNQTPPNTSYWSSTVSSISLSWTSGTIYTVGSVVYNSGSWYNCLTNHTSGATFAGDAAYWESSDWKASTAYTAGNLVYNSSTGVWYVCKTAHTSAATFSATNWNAAHYSASTTYSYGHITYYTTTSSWYRYIYGSSASGVAPTNTTYWKSITDWSSGTTYVSGDIVNYRDAWYTCTTGNSDVLFTAGNWSTLQFEKPFMLSWQYLAKSYDFNQVSYYSGTWYRRNVSSTIVALPNNTSYWENALSGSWAWASTDNYNIGDVVYRSGSFYRCIRAHSNQTPPNSTYWSTDPQHSLAWDSGKNYDQYDTVRHNAARYLSLQNGNSGNNPGTSSAYWAVAPRFVSAWSSASNYTIDNFVSYSGAWYRCIKDHTNQTPTNTTYWAAMTGAAYQWSAGTSYSSGSYVNYDGAWYKCIANTTANAGHSPNNATYWTASWAQSSGVTTGAPLVYAEGTITYADGSNSKTQLRALLAPAPLFPNAVASTNALSIAGAGTIDSYDANSSDGYSGGSGSTVGYGATLASNYSAGTAITISSTAVKGYLAAPSASTSPYAPLYSSGGTVKGANSPVSPNVDLSRVSRSPYIPQFDIKAAIQHTTLPTTIPTTLNLGTPGSPTPSVYYDTSPALGTTVNINGPVIWYVNGNFRVNAGDVVFINSTGSLTVYLTGSTTGRLRVESTSGGMINRSPSSSNPDPKNLVILGDTSYTSTQYYSYTTNPFHGVIYLPNITASAGLTIADGVTIYGALSAKKVTFSGAASLHYDTSLRYAYLAGVDQPYAPVEVRELTDATELATMP